MAKLKIILYADENDPELLQLNKFFDEYNNTVKRDTNDVHDVKKSSNKTYPARYIQYNDKDETKIYEYLEPLNFRLHLEAYKKLNPEDTNYNSIIGVDLVSNQSKTGIFDFTIEKEKAQLSDENDKIIERTRYFQDPTPEKSEADYKDVVKTIRDEHKLHEKKYLLNIETNYLTYLKNIKDDTTYDNTYYKEVEKAKLKQIKTLQEQGKNILPSGYRKSNIYFGNTFYTVYDNVKDNIITNLNKESISGLNVFSYIIAIFHVYNISIQSSEDYIKFLDLLGLSFLTTSNYKDSIWVPETNSIPVMKKNEQELKQLDNAVESLVLFYTEKQMRDIVDVINDVYNNSTIGSTFATDMTTLLGKIETYIKHDVALSDSILNQKCNDIQQMLLTISNSDTATKKLINKAIKTINEAISYLKYKNEYNIINSNTIAVTTTTSLLKYIDQTVNNLTTELSEEEIKFIHIYGNLKSHMHEAWKNLLDNSATREMMFEYLQVLPANIRQQQQQHSDDNDDDDFKFWHHTIAKGTNIINVPDNIRKRLYEYDSTPNSEKLIKGLNNIFHKYLVMPQHWMNKISPELVHNHEERYANMFHRMVIVAQDCGILPRGYIGCKVVEKQRYNHPKIYSILVQYLCFSVIECQPSEWKCVIKRFNESNEMYALRVQHEVVEPIRKRLQDLIMLQGRREADLAKILIGGEKKVRELYSWYFNNWPQGISFDGLSDTIVKNMNKDEGGDNFSERNCRFFVTPFESTQYTVNASSVFHTCDYFPTLSIIAAKHVLWFQYPKRIAGTNLNNYFNIDSPVEISDDSIIKTITTNGNKPVFEIGILEKIKQQKQITSKYSEEEQNTAIQILKELMKSFESESDETKDDNNNNNNKHIPVQSFILNPPANAFVWFDNNIRSKKGILSNFMRVVINLYIQNHAGVFDILGLSKDDFDCKLIGHDYDQYLSLLQQWKYKMKNLYDDDDQNIEMKNAERINNKRTGGIFIGDGNSDNNNNNQMIDDNEEEDNSNNKKPKINQYITYNNVIITNNNNNNNKGTKYILSGIIVSNESGVDIEKLSLEVQIPILNSYIHSIQTIGNEQLDYKDFKIVENTSIDIQTIIPNSLIIGGNSVHYVINDRLQFSKNYSLGDILSSNTIKLETEQNNSPNNPIIDDTKVDESEDDDDDDELPDKEEDDEEITASEKDDDNEVIVIDEDEEKEKPLDNREINIDEDNDNDNNNDNSNNNNNNNMDIDNGDTNSSDLYTQFKEMLRINIQAPDTSEYRDMENKYNQDHIDEKDYRPFDVLSYDIQLFNEEKNSLITTTTEIKPKKTKQKKTKSPPTTTTTNNNIIDSDNKSNDYFVVGQNNQKLLDLLLSEDSFSLQPYVHEDGETWLQNHSLSKYASKINKSLNIVYASNNEYVKLDTISSPPQNSSDLISKINITENRTVVNSQYNVIRDALIMEACGKEYFCIPKVIGFAFIKINQIWKSVLFFTPDSSKEKSRMMRLDKINEIVKSGYAGKTITTTKKFTERITNNIYGNIYKLLYLQLSSLSLPSEFYMPAHLVDSTEFYFFQIKGHNYTFSMLPKPIKPQKLSNDVSKFRRDNNKDTNLTIQPVIMHYENAIIHLLPNVILSADASTPKLGSIKGAAADLAVISTFTNPITTKTINIAKLVNKLRNHESESGSESDSKSNSKSDSESELDFITESMEKSNNNNNTITNNNTNNNNITSNNNKRSREIVQEEQKKSKEIRKKIIKAKKKQEESSSSESDDNNSESSDSSSSSSSDSDDNKKKKKKDKKKKKKSKKETKKSQKNKSKKSKN